MKAERSNEIIAGDFDRLARFARDTLDNNSFYHSWLLSRLPPQCKRVLDVGCGAGWLSQLVAARAERVVSLDLSRKMLRRTRARGVDNLSALRADFTAPPFAAETFDAIVSVAALHHVGIREALRALAPLLRPGGKLLVIDLVRHRFPQDYLYLLAGGAAVRMAAVLRPGNASAEERQAWDAHYRGDVFPTLREVREAAVEHAPGARVKMRLLCRYTLEWEMPGM